jgi:hypothetical protein
VVALEPLDTILNDGRRYYKPRMTSAGRRSAVSLQSFGINHPSPKSVRSLSPLSWNGASSGEMCNTLDYIVSEYKYRKTARGPTSLS